MQQTLGRLLAPLDVDPEEERLVPSGANGAPTWLDAGTWRAYASAAPVDSSGDELLTFTLEDGRTVAARWDERVAKVALPFDLDDALANLLSERWRAGSEVKRLSSSQIAAYYRLKRFIPRAVQLRARQLLARWQGRPEFPAWPFEASVVELFRFYVRCRLLLLGRDELRFRWFWPEGKAAAVTLTHDVESSEGLRLAVALADLEEEHGFRSSFNIVADWYPIDAGIVAELAGRGFEIGAHGVYHDRSMFSSRAAFEAQQPALDAFVARFDVQGFRSPATHRVFEWLADLPVSYDASIPHSDPYEPQPGGCCSIWPFFVGEVVELPYTLPQDHTLFSVLRDRSIGTWLRQVETLAAQNGLIQAVTHPDPGYLGDPDKRSLYEELLRALAERSDLWPALPRDVAAWWRQRDAGAEAPFRTVDGVARLAGDGVVLAPAVR